MKSPEEIKKGLKCLDCEDCPYDDRNYDDGKARCHEASEDALAYIEQLESDLERANNIIMQVKAMLDDDGK